MQFSHASMILTIEWIDGHCSLVTLDELLRRLIHLCLLTQCIKYSPVECNISDVYLVRRATNLLCHDISSLGT